MQQKSVRWFEVLRLPSPLINAQCLALGEFADVRISANGAALGLDQDHEQVLEGRAGRRCEHSLIIKWHILFAEKCADDAFSFGDYT
jgi:hypothetical protein